MSGSAATARPPARRIGYLTSSYARATDTFIRDEVTELRAQGDSVVTYSIRKSADSEVINDAVAAERAGTTYLLELPRVFIVSSVLREVLRRPARVRAALRLALEMSRPGIRGRLWPLLYLIEACCLARCLRRDGIEHLHNHIGEGSAAVAMLASALSGVPFSFTIHGPSEWDAPWNLALDVKAREAAFVAVISEYTRGQLRRWIEADDWDKVHIVRCGLAADFLASTPPDQQAAETVLVAVGRLTHEKGHRVLLDSLRRLTSSSDLRVVLVGDGPLRPSLERFVHSNGLDKIVTFGGWRSTTEVREILQGCSALVMSSFAEGLPVAIMEAFACAKPVISSDVGAVSELVRPGETGWLVNPGSADELRTAIESLLARSPEELRALGARGGTLVRERHDISAEVRRLRELFGSAQLERHRGLASIPVHVGGSEA